MALGLLRGDVHYYHRSRHAAPLWAACEREMLQERVTQGERHRNLSTERLGQREGVLAAQRRADEDEAVAPFLQRGLTPCPKCWPKESSLLPCPVP